MSNASAMHTPDKIMIIIYLVVKTTNKPQSSSTQLHSQNTITHCSHIDSKGAVFTTVLL